MSRARVLVPALLALALIAAGCGKGQSDTEAYKDKFVPLNAEIVSTGVAVGKAVERAPSATNAALAAQFAHLSDQAASLAGSLVRLDPPDDLKAEHDKLISGLRREAGDLNRISKAAIAGDPKAAAAAARAAVTDSAGIRDPRKALTEKLGIDR